MVIYLHFQHPFGSDGEFAGGGVGIDGEAVEVGDVGNAHLVDGELKNDNAVTACFGQTFVDILATLGVSLTVPLVAVGGGVEDGGAATVVDGQVQGDGAVATIGIGGAKGGLSV